jgi:hypothetical protein
MADKMVQGVVDGQRRLLGLGQAVEVGQDRRATVTQVEIELAAGAELKEVQAQSPPGQKTRGVGAGLLETRVGEAVEPCVELGEEVSGGLDEGTASDQGRPALSFRLRALALSRATES